MKNIKVLYIGNHTYSYNKDKTSLVYGGGCEVMSECILQYLKKYTSDIHFFSTSGPGKMIDTEYKDHYQISYCKRWDYKYQTLEDYINQNQLKFDLVVVNTGFDYRTSNFMNRYILSLDIPVLQLMHGLNCCHPRCLSKDYMKSSLVNFIVSTRHEYETLEEFVYSKDNLTLIDYPTGFEFDIDEIKDKSLENGVLSVARLVNQKGIPNAGLISNCLKTHLTCIGKTGSPDAKDIIKKLNEYNCDYHVLKAISREEVSEYIKNTAFLISLPDKVEGASLVIREAMTLGTPVITWSDFSLNEQVPVDHCIVLHHDENFVEEFEKIYVPKLDYYMSKENCQFISKYAQDRFSLSKFYDKLDKKLERILYNV